MSADLVALGDQLEAAAARALGRRRARRQSILNAAASILVAVPFGFAIASANLPQTLDTIVDTAPTVQPARSGYHAEAVQFPPDERIAYLRKGRTPDLLILPTTLRPALR
jgi:hypothetical protein